VTPVDRLIQHELGHYGCDVTSQLPDDVTMTMVTLTMGYAGQMALKVT